MKSDYTIENMQQHALERGGKCLSKEYWDVLRISSFVFLSRFNYGI